jgi:DNA-binding beta-propeller fold protein YncE
VLGSTTAMTHTLALTALLLLGATPAEQPPPANLTAHPLVLAPGRVVMDYLGYEPTARQVWAPGGNTGKVFVVDAATEAIRTVDGFATREQDGRLLGPSSVTFGPDTGFVGNRADRSVCAVDLKTLRKGACVTLADSPDGLAYVATTGEVWVTTPRSNSLTILSIRDHVPAISGKITLEGSPEGYAVAPTDGRFFTNLEDKSQTLEIDVRTRKVVRSWADGCGEKGPRGLAVDVGLKAVVVACTDAVAIFGLDGSPWDRVETGAGVDNIDILPGPLRIYVAAGKAESFQRLELTLARKLRVSGRAATSAGVRVVVVAPSGKAFAADSAGGRLLVIAP